MGKVIRGSDDDRVVHEWAVANHQYFGSFVDWCEMSSEDRYDFERMFSNHNDCREIVEFSEQVRSDPQYRFSNGHLYILIDNAYVHCFASAYAESMADAIEMFKRKIGN